MNDPTHSENPPGIPAKPTAYRYFIDKFACWGYSEDDLIFPAVPAGTKLEPLYSREAIAPIGRSQEPAAYRYWDDAFACWEYCDEAPDDGPVGGKIEPLYLRKGG